MAILAKLRNKPRSAAGVTSGAAPAPPARQRLEDDVEGYGAVDWAPHETAGPPEWAPESGTPAFSKGKCSPR